MPKETLLDLGRIPTLEELREFFRKNDWSATTYKEYDYDNLSANENFELEFIDYVKSEMDRHWEPLSREMGLKSDSAYFGKENPLIAMRDNVENLVATGVMKLFTAHPEKVEEILLQFFTENAIQNPEQLHQNADDMLRNAVKTAMQTMSYEEVAEVINATTTYEDFNHSKSNNYRSKDFDRKWNHTRAKMKTESLEEMKEKAFDGNVNAEEILADTSVNVAEEVTNKITEEKFWASINEEDRTILKMKLEGLTQKEIAEKLGYKTHSAITKRLQKLKEQFYNSMS